MSSHLIASHPENTIISSGVGVCKEKALEVFSKFSLPNAILYLDDVVEFGFNEFTGLMRLKRDKNSKQVHPKLGTKASFDQEVTAYTEDHRMHKITVFKVKEFLIWVPIIEAYTDDPVSTKLIFNTPLRIKRSFPISKFEEDE